MNRFLAPEFRPVTVNGVTYLVERYQILSTSTVVHVAYAPGSMVGTHHTITTIGGSWFGRVGTDLLPAELEALTPGSEARSEAVRTWREERYTIAYCLILAAFPDSAQGDYSMGEIALTLAA